MKSLAIICIILQVLDGILTGLGVNVLPAGLDSEGNPLVKEAMRVLGVIPALFIIKAVGVVAVLQVYRALTSPIVLSLVCGIYTISSVVWIFILLGIVQ